MTVILIHLQLQIATWKPKQRAAKSKNVVGHFDCRSLERVQEPEGERYGPRQKA